MKANDINKLDKETQKIIIELLGIGFKLRELGIYTMYANVHIRIPSSIPIRTLTRVVNVMPAGSSISTGNHFRAGLAFRLPWNLPLENYKNDETVFD